MELAGIIKEASEIIIMMHSLENTLRTYFSNHHPLLQTSVISLFTLTSSIRIVAYIPQILKIKRDINGASAISFSTWGLFLLSHLATISYAVICLGDLMMAVIFFGNALACLSILGVTYIKRRQYFKEIIGDVPKVPG